MFFSQSLLDASDSRTKRNSRMTLYAMRCRGAVRTPGITAYQFALAPLMARTALKRACVNYQTSWSTRVPARKHMSSQSIPLPPRHEFSVKKGTVCPQFKNLWMTTAAESPCASLNHCIAALHAKLRQKTSASINFSCLCSRPLGDSMRRLLKVGKNGLMSRQRGKVPEPLRRLIFDNFS